MPLVKLLDEIDYDDSNFVETRAYKWYLINYMRVKRKQFIHDEIVPTVGKDSVFWFTRSYALSKQLLNHKAHETYVMTSFYEFLSPILVAELLPYYEHFILTCSEENRQKLEDSFKFYTMQSKKSRVRRYSKIETTDGGFKEILEQYKGSLVYVDFWASWCGPCISEMSASVELQKKLNEEDVKFVFISVDTNEDSWKKAIATRKISGIHYRLDQEKYSDIVEEILTKGVPHYLIIGKDGKIIDDDAKRPSDAGLLLELEKLLEP